MQVRILVLGDLDGVGLEGEEQSSLSEHAEHLPQDHVEAGDLAERVQCRSVRRVLPCDRTYVREDSPLNAT